jgi:hypothetical protein
MFFESLGVLGTVSEIFGKFQIITEFLRIFRSLRNISGILKK